MQEPELSETQALVQHLSERLQEEQARAISATARVIYLEGILKANAEALGMKVDGDRLTPAVDAHVTHIPVEREDRADLLAEPMVEASTG
jgi:hypothetical protein